MIKISGAGALQPECRILTLLTCTEVAARLICFVTVCVSRDNRRRCSGM